MSAMFKRIFGGSSPNASLPISAMSAMFKRIFGGSSPNASQPEGHHHKADRQPTYGIMDNFFVLVTAIINAIGWSLTFVSMCGIESNTARGSAIGWVSVVFSPVPVALMVMLARQGNLHPGTYRFALAQVLVLLTALQAIFTDKVVTGRSRWFHYLYIFAACLQMGIQSLWVLYLGCDGDTVVVQALERYDSSRINAERRAKRRTIMSLMQGGIPQLPYAAPVSPIMIPMPNHGHGNVPPMPNMPEPAQLGGAASVPQYATLDNHSGNAKQSYEGMGQFNQVAPAVPESAGPSAANAAAVEAGESPVRLSEVSTNDPPVFNFRAKALYPYTADPNDPTEISFEIGEELEVANPHGNRWWQARKKDGTVGIAPSNYLQLIQE